jgi:AcrR family transcriptional regulator
MCQAFRVEKPPLRAPKQARSRLTLHRLLAAAEALLEHGGLEAATIPAIAEAAGVSVGSVYRRFPDKDALFRAVYLRFFNTAADQNRSRLQSLATIQLPLETVAEGLIRGIAEGYRRKSGLLRELSRYARTHRDVEFRNMARTLNRDAMKLLIGVFTAYRDKIRHPHPEEAIEFGLIAIASVLHYVVLEEETGGLHTPKNLDDELVRMFFGYLGLEKKKAESRKQR